CRCSRLWLTLRESSKPAAGGPAACDAAGASAATAISSAGASARARRALAHGLAIARAPGGPGAVAPRHLGSLAALLHIAQGQAVEHALEHRRLLRADVARRLLAQHVEQVDVRARHLEVLGALAVGQRDVAQVEAHRLGDDGDEVVEGARAE